MIIPKEFYLFGRKISVKWDINIQGDDHYSRLFSFSYRNNVIRITPNVGPYSWLPISHIEETFIKGVLSFILVELGLDDKIPQNEKLTVARLLHQVITSCDLLDRKKFRIPEEIQIFGHKIKIKWDEKLTHKHDNAGMALYDKGIICLQPNQGPYSDVPIECIEETFVHEMIHFVFWYTNEHGNITENDVMLISNLFYQAIKTSQGDLHLDLAYDVGNQIDCVPHRIIDSSIYDTFEKDLGEVLDSLSKNKEGIMPLKINKPSNEEYTPIINNDIPWIENLEAEEEDFLSKDDRNIKTLVAHYPANIIPCEEGYTVTFVDVFEAITQGKDLEDAKRQAEECLREAMAGRLKHNEEIPIPSQPKEGQYLIKFRIPKRNDF